MADEVKVTTQCGQCLSKFDDHEKYLDHVCSVTNYTPRDPEHLINSTTPEFEQVQKAALKRGAEAQIK